MFMLAPVRAHAIVWAAFLLAIAGGCANRNVVGSFAFDSAPPFSASGSALQPSRWWVSFDDAGLNQHIEYALGESYTLASALQRLRAARAVVRRESSDLWPDVNGISDVSSTFGPGEDRTSYVRGFDVSYQVDLWGEIQSRVDAEKFRAEATRDDYHAVALALTAEIVRTWFSLIEAHAQAALIENQIKTNNAGLKAQKLRFGLAGIATSPDVFRQKQLVESTLEQKVVIKARIEVLEHLLAVLLGRMPQEASYSTGSTLPELPPLPDTGLPSELLSRRPDVRRDYMELLGADRDLASAISAQYPRFSLTGSLTNISESPETIFRDWFVGLGAQLIAPLFDGGQRRAEVDRTRALVQLRFNEYGDTMLNAFREVEDALALERNQIERIKHIKAQVELAKLSSDRLREYYLIGDANYLDVLSAIQAQQQLQRDALTAQLELLLFRVALYLALAGDFDTCPQPVVIESVIPEIPNRILPGEADSAVPKVDDSDGTLDLSLDTESRNLDTPKRLPKVTADTSTAILAPDGSSQPDDVSNQPDALSAPQNSRAIVRPVGFRRQLMVNADE